jgi:hypothetical protein
VIEKINEKKRRVKLADLLAGLILLFSSILFFYDLFTGKYLLTERDLSAYFIPPRFFWVESIKNLEFPLWNAYQFSGSPFLANPQHGVFYPLNVFFFLLPFDAAFNGIILLHFFLGGLFTYLFLRDLKAEPSGALVSGLIFMLSGFLLSVHGLLSVLLSVIWTPLILLFFRRAIVGPNLRNEALSAAFMTLCFLGGGIEIVYGNFLVLVLMAVCYPFPEVLAAENDSRSIPLARGGSIGRGRFRVLLGRFMTLFVVSFLFMLLSAIQLIPFVELFFHSTRGNGLSYQEATIWSFAPKDILLFFLPDVYGYFLDAKKYWVTQCWFKTLYAGGLPFLLSGVYFVYGRNRKLFLTLAVFSVFLALGRYNPLYALVFKYVPFFNGIRYPAKFLYLFFLVLSVTAGLGFQKLLQLSQGLKSKPLRNLPILMSFLSGLFLLILVVGHQGIYVFLKGKGIDFPDFNHLSVNLYNGERFFFYMALFFLMIRIGIENGWKGWVKGLFIFFLVADLFGNMGFYGKEKTADYFQKTRILERITSDAAPFRVFSTKKTSALDSPILIGNPTPLEMIKEKHIPSINLLHRVHDIWGVEVIRLKRVNDLYRALTETESISSTNLIELYGVKYVISVTPLGEDPRFELVFSELEGLQGRKEDLVKENTVKLYRYRKPFQRGRIVGDFKVMGSKEILSTLSGKTFDPGAIVLLEEEPKFNGKDRTAALDENSSQIPLRSENNVEILSESNHRLALSVKTGKGGLLVMNDTYFPGWKACVDGRKEKIYRADYTFRAVPVSAGNHQVQFVYDPFSFNLGASMTLFGMAACLVVCFVTRRKEVSDERR